MHICYDGSFPETTRVLRVLGAQLLLLPTNWPEMRLKREMVQVRAWENHAFFLAVNRVGTERGVLFEGGSCAADPLGRLVMSAGADAGRFHFEVDLADADPSRVVIRPEEYEIDYVSDRRPDLYTPLTAPTPDIPRTGSQRSGEPI
jgi:predicted amidohydrolase